MSWLDWNSIENSRHGMTFSLKVPSKFSRSQWNDFAYTSLEKCPSDNDFRRQTKNTNKLRNKSHLLTGTVPHLEFSIEIESNNLTFENIYTPYQQFLYALCKQLHDKGYGYRRIAKMLNIWGV